MAKIERKGAEREKPEKCFDDMDEYIDAVAAEIVSVLGFSSDEASQTIDDQFSFFESLFRRQVPVAEAAKLLRPESFDQYVGYVRRMMLEKLFLPEQMVDFVLSNQRSRIEYYFRLNHAPESWVEDLRLTDAGSADAENRDATPENLVSFDVQMNILAMLKRLGATGLYGNSISQVAQTLMVRGIESVMPLFGGHNFSATDSGTTSLKKQWS